MCDGVVVYDGVTAGVAPRDNDDVGLARDVGEVVPSTLPVMVRLGVRDAVSGTAAGLYGGSVTPRIAQPLLIAAEESWYIAVAAARDVTL